MSPCLTELLQAINTLLNTGERQNGKKAHKPIVHKMGIEEKKSMKGDKGMQAK
jgi:hypothetical protein